MRILTERTKTMRARMDVCAPVGHVFDFAQDYAGRKGWDPFIEDLTTTGMKNGFPTTGTQVTVTAWHGLKMTCEYLKYDRPHCATIKMVKGPSFLQEFAGTWRFMYIEPELTAVVFMYRFKLKKGWSLLEPLAQSFFRWDMWRRVNALKREVEYEKHVALMGGVV